MNIGFNRRKSLRVSPKHRNGERRRHQSIIDRNQFGLKSPRTWKSHKSKNTIHIKLKEIQIFEQYMDEFEIIFDECLMIEECVTTVNFFFQEKPALSLVWGKSLQRTYGDNMLISWTNLIEKFVAQVSCYDV